MPVAMPGRRWSDRNQWLSPAAGIEYPDLRVHQPSQSVQMMKCVFVSLLKVLSHSILLTEWWGWSLEHR